MKLRHFFSKQEFSQNRCSKIFASSYVVASLPFKLVRFLRLPAPSAPGTEQHITRKTLGAFLLPDLPLRPRLEHSTRPPGRVTSRLRMKAVRCRIRLINLGNWRAGILYRPSIWVLVTNCCPPVPADHVPPRFGASFLTGTPILCRSTFYRATSNSVGRRAHEF